jgi:uncharacterized repeat protein (TIGR03803 family)
MVKKRMASMKLFRFLRLAAGISVMCLVVPGAWGGVAFTTLISFTGTSGAYPGANPYAGLVLGSDGNFYGTTFSGGTNNDGTIFQLTPGGAFTSLLSFNGTNGAAPYAALVPGTDGNFYGTTFTGGVSNWGTIFQITTNGTFTNLFSFTGTNNPYLGANPGAALVQAGDGSFYGTAEYGGLTNASYDGYGYGTVFRVTTNGTVTVPAFFNNTNGAQSSGGLVLGKDGNFYGTTTWGGRGISGTFPGYGTVFKMTPDGTLTNLYLFTGFSDGGFIYAGLVQGGDGYLYGGAFNGGSQGYGTLFKVSTNGSFTLLHTFTFFESGSPYGGLTEGSDGNFYGTTFGAFAGYGTVFQLTPGGAFTNLVSFNYANGDHPDGVLVQGPDGNFYGTTSLGGANGLGTIFRLSVPMPAVFKAITLTNGTATLTWSAVVGQTYQPQYSTNLTQTNWNTLSKPIVASNGTMTTTDSDAAGSPQRFYRVILFP